MSDIFADLCYTRTVTRARTITSLRDEASRMKSLSTSIAASRKIASSKAQSRQGRGAGRPGQAGHQVSEPRAAMARACPRGVGCGQWNQDQAQKGMKTLDQALCGQLDNEVGRGRARLPASQTICARLAPCLQPGLVQAAGLELNGSQGSSRPSAICADSAIISSARPEARHRGRDRDRQGHREQDHPERPLGSASKCPMSCPYRGGGGDVLKRADKAKFFRCFGQSSILGSG